MSKHTPGPWHAESGYVWTEAGIKVATPHATLNRVSIAERNANAKLVAAAPDLLEACGYCLKLLTDMGHGGLAGAILAESAIAKAEGRS